MKILGIILIILGGYWIFSRLLNQPIMFRIIKDKIDDNGLISGISDYLFAELFGFGFGIGIMGMGFYLFNPEFLYFYILGVGILLSIVFLWGSFELNKLPNALIILFGILGLLFWGIGGLVFGLFIGWITMMLIGVLSLILLGKIVDEKKGSDTYNLYPPDKIDARKVEANLLVFKHMSFELAESYSKFDKKEEELLKFATDSIKKIDFLGGVPLGFPPEFVATYPDVVLWWNNLKDGQDKILEGFDENDVLDKNEKIKTKYLEIIVKEYMKSVAKLECSY